MSGIQCVFHIVPDVQLLTRGESTGTMPTSAGVGAEPPRWQYFLNNIVFMSTTPAQQRAQRLRADKAEPRSQ